MLDPYGAYIIHNTGMVQRGGGAWGAHAPPPDFGRSEGAPHYYVPPQIFRLWTMPVICDTVVFISRAVGTEAGGVMQANQLTPPDFEGKK